MRKECFIISLELLQFIHNHCKLFCENIHLSVLIHFKSQPGVAAQPHPERKWKISSQTGIKYFMKTVPSMFSWNKLIKLHLLVCVPFQSFAMRKQYFNNPETGFFKKVKRKVIPKNPMTGKSYFNILK